MLYYIHGYESSPDGTKGSIFKEKLNSKAIKYRDCKPEDIVISDCLRCIAEEIKDDREIVLIGSSLGGFLAAKTAFNNSNVKQIILLNPALIPPAIDLNTINDIPMSILTDMKDDRLFNEKLDASIFIFAGIEDEIVSPSWVLEFARVQEATVKFLNDDHRFMRNTARLPDIITELLDKKH